MKDAVGSSLLVYLVVIIVGIVGACVIASSAYSKAYKAKTNIISIIDKYYLTNTDKKDISTTGEEQLVNSNCFDDETCKTAIHTTLSNMGYHMEVDTTICDNAIKKRINNNASEEQNLKYERIYPITYSDTLKNFDGYCIYKTIVNDTDYYYTVITFSHLNINVLGIGTLFKTPVYGETRVYY